MNAHGAKRWPHMRRLQIGKASHGRSGHTGRLSFGQASRHRLAVGWSGRLSRNHSNDVALSVHCFTVVIGFGGFKINRRVANRAIDLGLCCAVHTAPQGQDHLGSGTLTHYSQSPVGISTKI